MPAKAKAETKKAPKAEATKNDFKPTFRNYKDMNEGEQAAFKQGAKTVENKVKDKLGLIYKKAS